MPLGHRTGWPTLPEGDDGFSLGAAWAWGLALDRPNDVYAVVLDSRLGTRDSSGPG